MQESCGPLSWVVLCCAHRHVMAGYLNPAIGRVGQSSLCSDFCDLCVCNVYIIINYTKICYIIAGTLWWQQIPMWRIDSAYLFRGLPSDYISIPPTSGYYALEIGRNLTPPTLRTTSQCNFSFPCNLLLIMRI